MIDKPSTPQMQEYFQQLTDCVNLSYALADKARKKGLDPEAEVPIPLAKNMAERVVGLISVVAPQVMGSRIPERILELEKQYGILDWRVGFKIAEEVAKETHCKFETKLEAMEVGIRVGFAYLTLGIVSAPLEGFIGLKIKKRMDGKEYFSLQYAGPIRAAGGTAAAASVILSDYVRMKMGYAPYDPQEAEINRYGIEIQDYHERVTNLQYFPSEEELKFMVSHLPVEVDGDPTEVFEVSNYKDLPRVETNMIRGGVCLVLAEGLTQKAPKLWKKLSKWGKEFGLNWEFLADFIKLKEKIHAGHGDKEEKKRAAAEVQKEEKPEAPKVKPNDTFIMDLVAGRPILTHPMAEGGFRLRYGRGRTCGMYAMGFNPATLIVLDKYIAVGTQLKVERPRKGASVTLCDTIDGPIVRTKNGTVLKLNTEEEAKRVNPEIEEILFLGDMLFNYGDFSESGHTLVPAGYCPEWWIQELEKALGLLYETEPEEKLSSISQNLGWKVERLKEILKNPLTSFPTLEEARFLSKTFNLPLHPEYTFYWKLISGKEVLDLLRYLREGKLKFDENGIYKMILPFFHKDNETHRRGKDILGRLGIPHLIVNKDNLVLEKNEIQILCLLFDFKNPEELERYFSGHDFEDKNGLEAINSFSPVSLRDKAGTFIGARMGRPEKAKMRLMTGSPQVMFPIGEEGGRLRSFQSAIEAGKVTGDFPLFFCTSCQRKMIYPVCEECGQKCIKHYFCKVCGEIEKDTCRHGKANGYKKQEIDIKYYFEKAKQRVGDSVFPELIKGVRGTSNKEHYVEHLIKGVLRAKHNIYVNKDGTTRYDCTELPLTHFKPKEIKAPISKLLKLGYTLDIHGQPLRNEDQILELKSQDVILPGYDSLDESGARVLSRVADFVDELLVKFYGLEPFYNIKKEEDLIGHLIVGLAPHISAGIVGRIIGFSESQGFMAHPMYHAAMRRDCLGHDSYIYIHDGKEWSVRKIGEFVNAFNPKNKIDDYGAVGEKVFNISTLGYDASSQKIIVVPVKEVTKHLPSPTLRLNFENGRKIELTSNHIVYILKENKFVEKKALDISVNDSLVIPHTFEIKSTSIKSLNILDFYNKEDLMVSGASNLILKKIRGERKSFCNKFTIKERDLKNYIFRGTWPLFLVKKILKTIPKKSHLSIRRDNVKIPLRITLSKEVLWLIGIYVAEGCARKNESKKGFYQISIAATEEFIRKKIKRTCLKYFNLHPSRETPSALIYSSKLFYYFFTQLGCGSNAHYKRIPPLFLNLELSKMKYLLQGYFDGDGSTDTKELRASFDTVSEDLIEGMYFVLSRYGIYFNKHYSIRKPGKTLCEFYIRKGRNVPSFGSYKLTIPSDYCKIFAEKIGFSLPRKQKKLLYNLRIRNIKGTKINHTHNYTFPRVISIEDLGYQPTYCLNVSNTHNFIANNILVHNCDGDEACLLLLMDALLNFSRQYLPERRGAKTMDAPLVLTSILDPKEVDEQVLDLDIAWRYPLEMYEMALLLKRPGEVRWGPEQKKVPQLGDRLGTPLQYEGMGFTHGTENFNKGVLCSAYKTLPTMEEKLFGQMEIARKIRAVDLDDVARLVIQKHFLKDIKGNLKKFSMQEFRCVKCNEKFRRPPLVGKCTACGGKIIFTISEGSVIKYLGPSLTLCQNYNFSPYLKQTIEMLKTNVDNVFGKEKDKQVGLGDFFT